MNLHDPNGFPAIKICMRFLHLTTNTVMNLKTEHVMACVATGIVTWLIASILPFSPAKVVPDEFPKPLRIVQVDSITSLTSAIEDVVPGDLISVKSGVYVTTSQISISAEGTQEHPIVIAAEKMGSVVIRGDYGFRLEGVNHVIISGFIFAHSQDNSALNDGMAVMCNDCHNVRFTKNIFELVTSYEGQNDADLVTRYHSDWLGITGTSSDIRIDNNVFRQKSTEGAFLLLLGDSGSVVQNTLVDHNLFSGQSFVFGNGGECFRIGNSALGPSPGNMILEYNTFEHCDGDRESITIKSSNNIIRYNTFRNNEGSLTLRHGNGNTVDGNIFLDGNNGIRAYGHNQLIINNYFANNPTTVSDLLGPIIIGRGTVANDLTISNSEHAQAHDILIAHNTLVNNRLGIVVGYGEADDGTYMPYDITVANNIITSGTGKLISVLGGNITARNNILYAFNSSFVGDINEGGYFKEDPKLVEGADGIFRPSSSSPAVDRLSSADTYGISKDIDGETRTGMHDIGADEIH